MKPAQAARRRRGITLIEMLVGIAVLGIVVAAAVPSFSGMLERRRVIAVAGEIASLFAQARSESASLGTKVNVHLEPVPVGVGDWSCIRLSTAESGDTCRCDRPQDRLCGFGGAGSARLLREYLLPRDSSVTFTATADWGATPDVVTLMKGRFLNDDTNNVRVTVVGTRTQAKLRVDYISSGRVKTCSPDGSIGGFPICTADAS